MRSKSASDRSTPASRAIAIRCSTALVDPPVAATDAIAFSNAARVRMSRGFRPLFTRSMTRAGRARAAAPGCVAGTLPIPAAIDSTAVAMVFAVVSTARAGRTGRRLERPQVVQAHLPRRLRAHRLEHV